MPTPRLRLPALRSILAAATIVAAAEAGAQTPPAAPEAIDMEATVVSGGGCTLVTLDDGRTVALRGSTAAAGPLSAGTLVHVRGTLEITASCEQQLTLVLSGIELAH